MEGSGDLCEKLGGFPGPFFSHVTAKSGFFSVASNRGELYNEDICEEEGK